MSCEPAGRAGEPVPLTRNPPAATRVGDAEREQRKADLREWLDEWRWWAGGAVIMATIWGVHAIRSGADFFWPLVPLGIWAAILVAVALWPRDGA
jgi:hypothetical protein